MTERPKRLPIPDTTKKLVCSQQDGRCAHTGERLYSIYHAQFNHVPALGIRPVNEAGTDYDPPQLDPQYIEAVTPKAHLVQTAGPRVEKRRMLDPSYDVARIEKAKRLATKHAHHKRVMAAKVGQTPDR